MQFFLRDFGRKHIRHFSTVAVARVWLVHDDQTVCIWHVVAHLEGHWASRCHVRVAGFRKDWRLTSWTSSVSGGSLTLRSEIKTSSSPVEVSGSRSSSVTFLSLLHLLPDFEEFKLSVGPGSVFVISILVHGCLMLIERSCDADSVVEPRVDNVSVEPEKNHFKV